jgi:general secretion pathway protein I
LTNSGFTLLEVLVALAVLAIALAALLKAAAESSNTVSYLRDRTVASWVATNAVHQTWLSGAWQRGNQRGTQSMAGQDWRWDILVSTTADPDVRRLDVQVRGIDEDRIMTELAAFVRVQ